MRKLLQVLLISTMAAGIGLARKKCKVGVSMPSATRLDGQGQLAGHRGED